jgi:hypothetical protein
MYAVEFEAHIRNGIIEIPAEHQAALLSQINGDPVRIIVLARMQGEGTHPVVRKNLTQDASEKGYESFIDYLLDNPVVIPDVTYLSREEANAR